MDEVGNGGGQAGSRRRVLRGAGLVGLGAALGVVGFAEAARVAERKLPLLPGPAAATVGDRAGEPGRGQVRVTWTGAATKKLIALTFDDGPRPEWTELTLETFERHAVPATFFVVGRRVRKYAGVLRGAMARHEVGNHTWDHLDLARRSQEEAYRDLAEAHEAIVDVTGKVPLLCRPPYGHLGGSAILAADRLGYELVLWSLQMAESEFPGDPRGHARHIVSAVRPGTILLAHDIDAAGRDRRVAIDGLPEMIEALRARGYTFVTVSDLIRRSKQAQA
jgi:peptidoglycan/xylan/chitin deacetylase (PgdA/CDA1 family)